MRTFLFLSATLLLALNATAQNCPVRIFHFDKKVTLSDSSYIKSVLLENDSCSTHMGLILEKEIILSIKTSDHDRVYMISRIDGKVTYYFEVYADGRMYSYPLKTD
jgi:hypothetical protein